MLSSATAGSTARGGDGKRTLIYLLVIFMTVAAAYGYGRWQGASQARVAEQQAAAAQKEAEAARASAQSEAAAREATIRQLEARRQLHLTLMSLDKRNFGTAQEQLDAAARLLSGPGSAGNSGLAKLAAQMKETSVVAAGDFEAQREQILDYARRLDALIPPSSLPDTAKAAATPAETPAEAPTPEASPQASPQGSPNAPAAEPETRL
ncbi:MAG: hypothetical protein M3347_06845 [Armatimonadota bacterium]|nr:hypothetical protein [Armatimonadota bacterium]